VAELKTAIIVVDIINDFVTGVLGSKRARRIIPRVKLLLDHARDRKIPVIYTCDTHLPNLDREFEVWPPHAMRGTKGSEVVDVLKPQKNDFMIHKRRYNSFFGTELDMLLRELKIDTVVLVGLVTEICIQNTAAGAFFHGYHSIVPEDGVETVSDEYQKAGLDYMKRVFGAEITTIEKLLKQLSRK
jgi:nicotinamidase-related amidase